MGKYSTLQVIIRISIQFIYHFNKNNYFIVPQVPVPLVAAEEIIEEEGMIIDSDTEPDSDGFDDWSDSSMDQSEWQQSDDSDNSESSDTSDDSELEVIYENII